MRAIIKIIAAALVVSAGAARADAQFIPRGYYAGAFAVNPYVAPPAFATTARFASPYGYRSYFSAGAFPGPWGYNTFYNYGVFVRPYVAAPFHSVIFNPFTFSYQYVPGYLNAPTFFYGYWGW